MLCRPIHPDRVHAVVVPVAGDGQVARRAVEHLDVDVAAGVAFRRYQPWVEGRKTPTVSTPSAFQSPASGRSAGVAKVNVTSGSPGVLLLRSDQV